VGLYKLPGVPHRGWRLVDVIDLHDDEGLEYGDYEDCQFCDHEQIRYVHLLGHSSYDGIARVGCICACKLTEDYVNPKLRERELRNRSARRQRFPDRKWKLTRQGGKSITVDGHRVTVGLKGGKYRIWIDSVEGKLYFDAERQAMLRAYDYIQKKKAKGRI
jgi:hypothetical protein